MAESSFLEFKSDICTIYGKINTGKKYPPPIRNEKLLPGTLQSPTELFDKTKQGSRNFWRIFRQHKIDPKTTSANWENSLQDPSITITEINKSLNWLTKAELCQEQIDRRQRHSYRKTQFRDQLSHHDKTLMDNNCLFCKK